MSPFAGKPRSYRHTSLVGARLARDTPVQPTLHAQAPCCVFKIAGRPCGPLRSLRQRLQGFAPGIKNRGQTSLL
ncbi:hypothetical protein C4K14_4505 [Pseudomonas chlororaphis subsp. aureofaciens]|nr:hypothetical protein C4K14_4505 [Pseudomonas chlororaphis subsp. aureofaciens]